MIFYYCKNSKNIDDLYIISILPYPGIRSYAFLTPHKKIMWFLFMIFRGLVMNNSNRILHLQGVLNARELGGLPLKEEYEILKKQEELVEEFCMLSNIN